MILNLGESAAVRGPFTCYVTQHGVGGYQISLKKNCYKDARFNIISVTRGWVGVEFPEKHIRNT